MEVKNGYKSTELGLIPTDWNAVRLAELFSFKNGLNKARQFFGRGTPIVNYMDVFSRTTIRSDAIQGLVEVTPKELSAYEVRKGDVFFTRTSETVDEIGSAAVMLDAPEKTVYSGFVLRARPTSKTLDDSFKAYCFTPRYFRQQITARASYTTRALTNGRSLSAAVLALPPIEQQRAIATALSDVDTLIVGLEKLIAKKRDLKQAAMQQLLTGQTRLPGFSGKWAVKRLGDVGECLRGVSYKGDADLFPHDTDRSKRLLRSNNVQESLVVTSDLQYVKVDRVREHQVLREGDILICMANGSKALVGKAGYFEINDGFEYTFGAFMGAYRGNEQANRRFVFYFFQTNRYRDYITNLLAGSSINNLSPSSIESLEFNFPELDEQDAIAQALRDMDGELASLESRLAKTHTIKQGMMQELLIGKTRLV